MRNKITTGITAILIFAIYTIVCIIASEYANSLMWHIIITSLLLASIMSIVLIAMDQFKFSLKHSIADILTKSSQLAFGISTLLLIYSTVTHLFSSAPISQDVLFLLIFLIAGNTIFTEIIDDIYHSYDHQMGMINTTIITLYAVLIIFTQDIHIVQQIIIAWIISLGLYLQIKNFTHIFEGMIIRITWLLFSIWILSYPTTPKQYIGALMLMIAWIISVLSLNSQED